MRFVTLTAIKLYMQTSDGARTFILKTTDVRNNLSFHLLDP